jgi:hypothetical protein
MAGRPWFWLATLGCLAACSEPTPAPTPSGTIFLRRVSGSIPDDSIFRAVRDPLVYELVDGTGVPVVGALIRFRSSDSTAGRPTSRAAFVWTGPLDGDYAYAVETETRTDDHGRVAVLVARGTHPGQGWLTITADSLALADSIPFRIAMGTPQFLLVQPYDTSITPGTSYPIRALLVDAGDHIDSTSATVRSDSGFVTVNSRLVTGSSYGFGTLSIQYGALTATARVSVVPPGTVALIQNSSVVLVRTDGTDRRVLYSWSGSVGGHPSIDWLDPTSLVMPDPSGQGLIRIGVDGSTTPIAVSVPNDGRQIRWVQADPNGRTVYFAFDAGSGLPEIWRTDVQTGAASLVLGSGFRYLDTFPSVSPDGRSLVFTTNRTGIATVATLDLTSGALKVSNLRGVAPRWLVDGEHFVYVAAPYLRVARIDESDQRYLGPVGVIFNIGYDPSPDGRWIAAPAYTYGVALVDLTTATIVKIPSTEGALWIAWQP